MWCACRARLSGKRRRHTMAAHCEGSTHGAKMSQHWSAQSTTKANSGAQRRLAAARLARPPAVRSIWAATSGSGRRVSTEIIRSTGTSLAKTLQPITMKYHYEGEVTTQVVHLFVAGCAAGTSR